ncbi:hypothetical protein BDA96_07G006700 [Sorghum bicolor]|uniref:Uncharacterized protein n=1 Tax=Sorghum bicolor TaxID=4558 RepID=A0A921U8D0_SORBI|nr:hypothetical protein BDA96_07G006700 [Sorghum bicolor]
MEDLAAAATAAAATTATQGGRAGTKRQGQHPKDPNKDASETASHSFHFRQQQQQQGGRKDQVVCHNVVVQLQPPATCV